MFAKVIAIAYFKNFTFSDLNISHASSSLLLDIPFIGINYSLLLALLLIKNHIRVSDTYASFKLLIHIQLALIVGVIHKENAQLIEYTKTKIVMLVVHIIAKCTSNLLIIIFATINPLQPLSCNVHYPITCGCNITYSISNREHALQLSVSVLCM